MKAYPWLQTHPDGVSLELKVQPRASRNSVVVSETQLKVRLHAPPVDGKANEELLTFLQETLQISRNKIIISRGEKSRTKLLMLHGKQPEEVLSQLLNLETS